MSRNKSVLFTEISPASCTVAWNRYSSNVCWVIEQQVEITKYSMCSPTFLLEVGLWPMAYEHKQHMLHLSVKVKNGSGFSIFYLSHMWGRRQRTLRWQSCRCKHLGSLLYHCRGTVKDSSWPISRFSWVRYKLSCPNSLVLNWELFCPPGYNWQCLETFFFHD